MISPAQEASTGPWVDPVHIQQYIMSEQEGEHRRFSVLLPLGEVSTSGSEGAGRKMAPAMWGRLAQDHGSPDVQKCG